MDKRITYLVLATLGLLLACAVPKPVGTMTLVESSGSKPDWAVTVPDDDDDTMFWVCRKTQADTEDGALVSAREDCGRQVADYLQQTATKVYESARIERAATMDLGTVRPLIRDTYTSWYEKVKAHGLRTKQTYTERWETVVSQERVRYLFNGYALMTVSKEQLLALGQQAIDEQLQKARETSDAMAIEALDAMKSRLELLQR